MRGRGVPVPRRRRAVGRIGRGAVVVGRAGVGVGHLACCWRRLFGGVGGCCGGVPGWLFCCVCYLV